MAKASSKLILVLFCMIALGTQSGCRLLPRYPLVYVGEQQAVEVAKSVKIRVWVTNKETGKRELGYVEAHPGWTVGR